MFSVRRNENALKFNEDLGGWNMSGAENLDSMFLGCENFEGKGVDKWDVSRVKSMSGTFESCLFFDQDLSLWNTSSLEDFSFLFARSGFSGRGLDVWDTASAYNMSYTFFELARMDADFSSWNTSGVVDMSYMVGGFEGFLELAFVP